MDRYVNLHPVSSSQTRITEDSHRPQAMKMITIHVKLVEFTTTLPLLSLLLLEYLLILGGAETHVPIVANHNNQIRLNIGDHLRLECPVHSTSSGSLTDFGESGTNTIQHDEASGVLYHWRVRDRLDYTLDSDPRYRFSQNRRVLEVTVPLEVADSGTYTCTGVTGFGKREVTFEVHVRDPDSNLLCAPTPRTHQNVKGMSTFYSEILYHLELDSFASQLKQCSINNEQQCLMSSYEFVVYSVCTAPCFLDPLLKQNPVITVEQPVGSTVKLNCEADGTEPIRYRWFMGNTVADWITTSQGARGPILTIDHVGREHTGHYTCQVSNIGGSLNYTYRLVVTELPSATPKIIGTVRNYTFTSDASASLTAQIQCACDEPVIQWLKRVEPGEESTYEQNGARKIPLPNAREAERNEVFVILGSWPGSPAVVEKTISQAIDPASSGISRSPDTTGQHDSSPYYNTKPHAKIPPEQVFTTKLNFQKPLDKEKQAGKYIVMTMNPGFLKGRRVLFYFLIPFGLLFIILGLVAYVFFCRRKGSTRNSLSSSNERCILRTTDLSSQAYHVMLNGKKTSSLQTSSRHSSNSQVTGRQPYALLGIQSPLLQSEIRPAAATNGIGQHNSLSEASTRPAYYAVGAPQGQTTVTPLIGMPNTTNQNSNSDFNNAGNNAYFPVSHTSTQRNLPYPPTVPVTMFGGMVEQQQFFMTPSGPVASNSSGYEGSNGQFHHFQPVHSFSSSSSNQRMNVPIAPSIATEISFDQYSAVSQGQLSSGTLTNHYTAPFNDYSRGHGPEMTDNTGNMQHNFPRA
ncbi:immunoglobulin domain protein [Opisthorchis viverrini]|uniref:Immunoglobulin domain protein n=1 Tax=Opisthorchis viverrini TaxID=6198 RepID=A0A1S8WHP3_OPIVI|nr:immunoglobulin domain protein [Opisthorchis viverrini]